MDHLTINYRIDVGDGAPIGYSLEFERKTMTLLTQNKSPSPWTKLENEKCKHCPLKTEEHPNCPIAVNLETVASSYAKNKSYDKATIMVSVSERSYVKKATVQEGLQGLFGLVMATSGCPHMDFLKPMARFHLPFASDLETSIRSVSFYLLRQYFNLKDSKPTDWDLKDLEKSYAAVNEVNLGIVSRIRQMSEGDADRNAIVILDSFAQLLTYQISTGMQELREAIGL